MRMGRLAPDTGDQLLAAGNLQIQKPQCVLRVKPLDQVLDIRLGILRVHETGHGAFKFTPVDDHRGVHREVIVLAGMVDMQMRVDDVADIAGFQAMPGELVLDHVVMGLKTPHPQAFHDRVVAISGVDHDGMASAQNQEAVDRHPRNPPAMVSEHQKTVLELDVTIIEQMDL